MGMTLDGWSWMVSDTVQADTMNHHGASDQVMSKPEIRHMNEMLTDVNRSLFLLTIRNPRFLIAIYNRSSYRCSHLIANW